MTDLVRDLFGLPDHVGKSDFVVKLTVRTFLLAHPLWRPIAQGCVVRREGAPQTLRLSDEALADVPDVERVRFVLSQVEG